jgi:hypothetical protein
MAFYPESENFFSELSDDKIAEPQNLLTKSNNSSQRKSVSY